MTEDTGKVLDVVAFGCLDNGPDTRPTTSASSVCDSVKSKLNSLVSIVNRMSPILESHRIGQEGPFILDDITLDRIGCRTLLLGSVR